MMQQRIPQLTQDLLIQAMVEEALVEEAFGQESETEAAVGESRQLDEVVKPGEIFDQSWPLYLQQDVINPKQNKLRIGKPSSISERSSREFLLERAHLAQDYKSAKLEEEFLAEFQLVLDQIDVGEVAHISKDLVNVAEELQNLHRIIVKNPESIADYAVPITHAMSRGFKQAAALGTELSEAGFFELLDKYSQHDPPLATIIDLSALLANELDFLNKLELQQSDKLWIANLILRMHMESDAFDAVDFSQVVSDVFKLPSAWSELSEENLQELSTEDKLKELASLAAFFGSIGAIGLNIAGGALGILVMDPATAMASVLTSSSAALAGASTSVLIKRIISVQIDKFKRSED